MYLRLQVDAVRRTLAAAEGPPDPQPLRQEQPAVLPAFASSGRPTGFAVQQKRTPLGAEPAIIHTDDCSMSEGTTPDQCARGPGGAVGSEAGGVRVLPAGQ